MGYGYARLTIIGPAWCGSIRLSKAKQFIYLQIYIVHFLTIHWSGVLAALACVNENAYVWAHLVTHTYFQKHHCKEYKNYLTRKVNAQVTHIHVTTFNALSTTQFISQRLPLRHQFSSLLFSHWHCCFSPCIVETEKKCVHNEAIAVQLISLAVSKRWQSSLWSQRDSNIFTFSKMLTQSV